MRNFVSCIFRRPLKKSSAFMRIYVSSTCSCSFLLLSVVGFGAKKKTAKSGLNFGRVRLYHLALANLISPLLTSRLAVGVKKEVCPLVRVVAKNCTICSLTLLRIKNLLKCLDNSITALTLTSSAPYIDSKIGFSFLINFA